MQKIILSPEFLREPRLCALENGTAFFGSDVVSDLQRFKDLSEIQIQGGINIEK